MLLRFRGAAHELVDGRLRKRGEEGERSDAGGGVQGDVLGDCAPVRCAIDVGAVDPQDIEELQGIGGNVVERLGERRATGATMTADILEADLK